MPAMIAFKTIAALDQWERIDLHLRQIVLECLAIWPDKYMEITRISDPLPKNPDGTPAKESGVHLDGPPHRALDLRTNDINPAVGTKVETFINHRWIYGDPTNPGRKVAMQHGEKENRHLHVQVRASTRPRPSETTT